MQIIATLTLNPAIDAAYEVDKMHPTHKMRSHEERYDPGGGGINVARVVAELGGMVRAYYAAGGPTGAALGGLLDVEGLPKHLIPINGATRLSATVRESETGDEYRIVPRGPNLSESEWQNCLAEVETMQCDILVASGSLPDGAPEDFYRRAAAIAAKRGIKFILDSSGRGLKHALGDANILLIKPSRGELRTLVGKSLDSEPEIVAAARDLVATGAVQNVAVTLAHDGAILVTSAGTYRLPALPIEVRSSVGAGDSFLGAMVVALSQDKSVTEAFRFGLAAGTAAVMSPGTQLCSNDAVRRLFAQVGEPALIPEKS